jgi:hypothetical protein
VVVGSGSVVMGGAVVGGGGVVVVGGPRRGPGPDDGPDCPPSCGGEVTGTVAIGAAAGAGAAVVAVVVVVDSSTAVVGGGGRVCCTSTGAATGATAVVGVLSRFAGTRRGCSAAASNATATKPATNARHTSDIVVVTTCARRTRRRPARRDGAVSGSTGAPHSGHRAYAPLIGDPHVPQYCATARASCTIERLTGPPLRGTSTGHSSCHIPSTHLRPMAHPA